MSGPHGGRFAGSFMMTVSQDDEPETISSMAQRLSRVHGLRVTGPRHHSNQSQSLHLSPPQGVTQPPLPAVVQNLLGPESSSDGIQFSSSTSLERKCALTSFYYQENLIIGFRNPTFMPEILMSDFWAKVNFFRSIRKLSLV